jgi:hypothetical protein
LSNIRQQIRYHNPVDANLAVNQSFEGEITHMKKLMTLMLGLTLVFGTVAVTFAQDAPKKEEKKEGKKKGGKKKEGEGEKKGGL